MNRFFSGFYTSPFKVYAVLATIPLLLFLKSLYYDFSPMDEHWLITENILSLNDWSNLFHSFNREIQKVYFRPVLIDTFVIDYQIGRLNPFVYHLSNIIFHIVAVILLYKLLLRLAIENKAAFTLCLIFAIHPMVVHAVTWIPGRNDVLLCIFFLTSAIYLLKYIGEKKSIQLFLHFLFFLLAMLTKETAVAFPLIFLSILLIRSEKKNRLLFPAISWIVVLLVWFYLRQRVLQDISMESKDFFSTLLTFSLSLIAFTGKSLLPVSQSVTPVIGNSLIWLNAFIVVVFAVLCFVFGIRNKKTALLGIITFYVVLFLPVWFGSQTTLGEQYEHRAYTALVGLIIFLSQVNFNYNSAFFKTLLATVFIFFIFKTLYRQNTYKTEISYLDEGIEDCPRNYFFHSQKGILLYFQGNFAEALPCMDRAIVIYPGQAKLHNNRGKVHYELGHKKETIDDYTLALKLSNYKTSIHLARCMAYKKFGEIDKAKDDLEDIKKRDPKAIPMGLEKEINTLWLEHKILKLDDL
ncbi:MAG: glycosyltransferase family 39 protein, partial [Bacteroidia bacterium]|nr:glycosyltransferase family 39 protein [Bacteroidia bacterium]